MLGHPIGHSVSPQMHNAALAALSRRDTRWAGWTYERFDIDPASLGEALPLFLERGFVGLNLTVPHKVLALSLVASAEPEALQAGAVNTLHAGPGGWLGSNTDGYGLATAVREDLGLALAGARVVLLGAGGAARGAATECLRAGCAELWLYNRSADRLAGLVRDLAPLDGSGRVRTLGAGRPGPGALVINATSLGLKAADPSPLDLGSIGRPAAVFDMIYNPPSTRLLEQARAMGIPASGGLGMLVHQGARSLETWTGAPAAETAPVMRAAAAMALG